MRRPQIGILNTLWDAIQAIRELTEAVVALQKLEEARGVAEDLWAPGSVAAGSLSAPKNLTVAGAEPGMPVLASYTQPLVALGVRLVSEVIAANTVRTWIQNPTAGAVAVPAGTLRVEIPRTS